MYVYVYVSTFRNLRSILAKKKGEKWNMTTSERKGGKRKGGE